MQILNLSAVILANLCVSYIMSSQTEDAEEMMRKIEKEEVGCVLTEVGCVLMEVGCVLMEVGCVLMEDRLKLVVCVCVCVCVCRRSCPTRTQIASCTTSVL